MLGARAQGRGRPFHLAWTGYDEWSDPAKGGNSHAGGEGPGAVPPGCTLEEGGRLLGSHRVGSLLVVDGDRLVGIVTDRDITVRGIGEGKASSTPVEAIMTPDPVTIQGSADVYEAFTIFKSATSRRLPVLEDKD